MDTKRILDQLRTERERLDRAIEALEALDSRRGARRGRPPGTASASRRGRRRMSAAARKRISEMMKLRWAERKKRSRAA